MSILHDPHSCVLLTRCSFKGKSLALPDDQTWAALSFATFSPTHWCRPDPFCFLLSPSLGLFLVPVHSPVPRPLMLYGPERRKKKQKKRSRKKKNNDPQSTTMMMCVLLRRIVNGDSVDLSAVLPCLKKFQNLSPACRCESCLGMCPDVKRSVHPIPFAQLVHDRRSKKICLSQGSTLSTAHARTGDPTKL